MSDSNIKNMLINIAKKTSLLSPKSMRLNRKILSCVKNENDKPLYVNKVVEYFVRNIVLLSFGYRHIKKDMFMAEGLVHRVVSMAVNFGWNSDVVDRIMLVLSDEMKDVHPFIWKWMLKRALEVSRKEIVTKPRWMNLMIRI